MAASIRPDAGQTRRSLNELSRLGTRLSRLHQRHEELTGSLRTALDRYREAQAAALLNSIPVEQLSLSRSAPGFAPLQEAGFRQVGQLLGISQSRLERIDGVRPGHRSGHLRNGGGIPPEFDRFGADPAGSPVLHPRRPNGW